MGFKFGTQWHAILSIVRITKKYPLCRRHIGGREHNKLGCVPSRANSTSNALDAGSTPSLTAAPMKRKNELKRFPKRCRHCRVAFRACRRTRRYCSLACRLREFRYKQRMQASE